MPRERALSSHARDPIPGTIVGDSEKPVPIGCADAQDRPGAPLGTCGYTPPSVSDLPPAAAVHPEPRRRPYSVTGAAVYLIVAGALLALFGTLLAIGMSALPSLQAQPEYASQLPDIPDDLRNLLLIVAAGTAVLGLADVISGGFALAGRPWARGVGIGLSIVGALGSIFLFMVGLTPFGTTVVGIALVGDLYVIWAFASNAEWFAPR